MKKIILRIFKKLGYRISKGKINYNGLIVEHDFEIKHKWLIDRRIKTVLDIGANTGQFASKVRALFPSAQIYSFEPIQSVYDQLNKKFEFDSKFKAFNIGLGNSKGKVSFFQNGFSDSSSLLPMKKLHKESFPKTTNEKEIKIQIDQLDNIINDLVLESPILIKIDVQGFEDKVISGGEKVIRMASIAIIEVGFYELYENQVMFNAILLNMNNLGFTYKGNYDQLLSPIDGSVLQADAIFLNENG